MTPRTWTIIGATVLVLGIGVYALGLFSDEARMRQVGHVLADPDGYASGTWTVVGLPQPAKIPVSGDGATQMVANPDYRNETRHVRLLDDHGLQEVLVLRLERSDDEGHHFTHTRQVLRPGDGVEDETVSTFTVRGTVFQIEGFDVDGAGHAHVWAVYQGVLKEPLQPKPSQFTGNLTTVLPDGTPLAPGAYLYRVTDVTVGCSSKFLPPDYES